MGGKEAGVADTAAAAAGGSSAPAARALAAPTIPADMDRVARRVVARWRALLAERKGVLLLGLLERYPDLVAVEVLQRLDPTDRTIHAQVVKASRAAVLASGLPRFANQRYPTTAVTAYQSDKISHIDMGDVIMVDDHIDVKYAISTTHIPYRLPSRYLMHVPSIELPYRSPISISDHVLSFSDGHAVPRVHRGGRDPHAGLRGARRHGGAVQVDNIKTRVESASGFSA